MADTDAQIPTRLNLGCGYRKLEGYINIDNREEVEPDVYWDLRSVPWRFNGAGYPKVDPDSVDEVRAVDFLEHINIGHVIDVIEEIYRVLKPGGTFYSVTPSTDGRGAFQDPFHWSYWNRNSWLYYMDDAHRNLYGIKAKFEGNVFDHITDGAMKIIHTVADLRKV